MLDVVIAVALTVFLGPGMGQLYNREYRKAIYLIGVSLVVLIGMAVWTYKASLPFLPVSLTTVDPGELQTLIKNAAKEVAAAHRGTLLTYEVILLALWFYSIIDSARVALRRKKTISEPTTTSQGDHS